MRWLSGFVLLMVLIIGCSDSDNKNAPIKEKEMIELLADIHFTDAMLIRGVNQGSIKNKDTYQYYKFVMEKHNITPELFDSAYNYYCRDFKKFDKMYDKVITILKQREEQLETSKTEANTQEKK